MTASPLPEALRACAAGICTHEAGVSLLIANRTFLSRDDFTSRFITRDPTAAMAAIDWAAAIAALDAGEIRCSGGEQRSSGSPRASPTASPSASATPSPGSTRNARLVVQAVAQATGHAISNRTKRDEKVS